MVQVSDFQPFKICINSYVIFYGLSQRFQPAKICYFVYYFKAIGECPLKSFPNISVYVVDNSCLLCDCKLTTFCVLNTLEVSPTLESRLAIIDTGFNNWTKAFNLRLKIFFDNIWINISLVISHLYSGDDARKIPALVSNDLYSGTNEYEIPVVVNNHFYSGDDECHIPAMVSNDLYSGDN